MLSKGLIAFDGNENVVIAGGKEVATATKTLKSAEIFEKKTRQWKSIAPMNYYRASFKLVTSTEGVFAIGGDSTKKIEKLDLDNLVWIETNFELPLKLQNFGATAVPEDMVQ